MYVFIAISLVGTLLATLFNILRFRYIINKAIEKSIKPKLQSAGLIFDHYKWLGFFNHGDFKNDEFILLPSIKFGYASISTYINIYYFKNSEEKSVTARIDTSFGSIVKVSLSAEL